MCHRETARESAVSVEIRVPYTGDSAMNRTFSSLMSLFVLASASALAGDAKIAAGEWRNLTEDFLKVSGKRDFRVSLAVDRATGNLLVSRWTTGVWMSTDQGKTFTRADGEKVSVGGPISPHALLVSPDGGKLAAFNMNNKPGPCGYSLDQGKTWQSFDSVGRNWDYGAVDWNSKVVLAVRHEDQGVHLSTDLGQTWTALEIKRRAITGIGVLGAKELVFSRDGKIEHSADAGKTWSRVADYEGTGPVQVFKGVAYWLANKRDKSQSIGQVIVSTDKGKTWQTLGNPFGDRALAGPCFGKDEKHIVVSTPKGIVETRDAGATWQLVTSYPTDAPEIALNKDRYGELFPSIGYDAAHNVYYLYLVNTNPKQWGEGPLLKYAPR